MSMRMSAHNEGSQHWFFLCMCVLCLWIPQCHSEEFCGTAQQLQMNALEYILSNHFDHAKGLTEAVSFVSLLAFVEVQHRLSLLASFY